ncbi:hypothetical protein [Streptomyces sp. NPDC001492]
MPISAVTGPGSPWSASRSDWRDPQPDCGRGPRRRRDPLSARPQRQLLAVAVVLASLSPAPLVVLGLALLHERVTPRQTAGLLGAAATTVLPTLG